MDNVKGFLEKYAEVLRCEEPRFFTDFAPFTTRAEMPAGCVTISDQFGNRIISVAVNKDPKGLNMDCPSMPVTPLSISYAKFITNALNAYAESLQENKDD